MSQLEEREPAARRRGRGEAGEDADAGGSSELVGGGQRGVFYVYI